ncbi:MAG: BLUF domain-containing protein [Kangiellaceae bacterium]|jgi:hypothetical protein|nr:BLUF domain-containing protein [Kangiellaceae bacterium]
MSEKYYNPLVELVYTSQSISLLDEGDVDSILDGAHEKNAKLNISGILIYNDGVFLQLIEGPRDSINQLFQSISHDARHFDINLISFSEVTQRNFESWEMGNLKNAETDGLVSDNLKNIKQSEYRDFLVAMSKLLNLHN